jgi:hypothetical protein
MVEGTKVGDSVRIIAVPPSLPENELKTRSLFEACVGRVFQVQAVEDVEGLDHTLIRLDVGETLGKNAWEHTIWIEPDFVEVANLMPR